MKVQLSYAVVVVGLISSEALSVNEAVKTAYNAFDRNFPHHRFGVFLEEFDESLRKYANTSASTAYDTIEGQWRCPSPKLSTDMLNIGKNKRLTPVPGTSVPVMAMTQVGNVVDQLSNAAGPAAAQIPGIASLAKAALTQVKGVLQTVAAVVATDVPPTIPPPAWNNMPFPCMPMVTGHNCFGAVLYPITIGDFIMADVTDAALDGVVASFPSYYRSHVGVTDDATYDRCFSSYMSMQCANAFPTCTTVQARQDEIPGVGRGPMCFVHCIQTLLACPGLWVDDLEEICMHVSAPPVCSFAVYNKGSPPQLSSNDEAASRPLNCPSV